MSQKISKILLALKRTFPNLLSIIVSFYFSIAQPSFVHVISDDLLLPQGASEDYFLKSI